MVLSGDENVDRGNVGKRVDPSYLTVVGAFDDPNAAERAVDEFRRAGFADEDLSVVERGTDAADEIPSQAAAEQASSRSLIGAIIGALIFGTIGFVLAEGIIVIPGLEPFLGFGTILTTLGAALVGAGAGFWIGATTSVAAVPEDVSQKYVKQSTQGRYMVMVRTDEGDPEQKARKLLSDVGSKGVESYPYQARPKVFPGSRTDVDNDPDYRDVASQ